MKKNKDQPLEDKCIGKNNDNSNNTLENVNEIGTPNLPEINNNIQFITIIGEIEGHTISPAGKKQLNMNI